MVCLRRLVSNAFKDKLGVREGAVESPHQFNMYIDDLKDLLETEHPNLCKMAGVILAVLLYADDAALPADSVEDLPKSAGIVERYFNDRRLFISTPKSFITVFHDPADTQVCYNNDQVFVDGQPVVIKIYGETIAAVSTFKYLGILFDEFGSPKAHLEARCSALLRAGVLLLTGLRRLPGYAHDFLIYLW